MDHTELLRKDVIGSIRAWIDARVHPHSKRLGSGVFDAVLGRLKFGEMTLIDAVVLIGLGLVFFTWGALVTAWNPERAQHALAFFHLAPK
jgi:hypothetical protein